VREEITLIDTFHGGYRDVPVRPGQEIDSVAVSEQGRRYTRGGSVELGSVGPSDQFQTARIGDKLRIVWHFDNPSGGARTFTVQYRVRGVAIAYDDVVDVVYRVWGEEWNQRLQRLDGAVELPRPAEGPEYKAWAGPRWVPGYVTQEPARVTFVAGPVPAHQFVDVRVVFPRRLLTSTESAIVRTARARAHRG